MKFISFVYELRDTYGYRNFFNTCDHIELTLKETYCLILINFIVNLILSYQHNVNGELILTVQYFILFGN